ncbi:MAG: hypothetical protein JWN79_889 [Gemmatimonadetes bacterium]|jgi:hypothetical protein|nr:hypothetical protein [Gemmatimonadota bacterium]
MVKVAVVFILGLGLGYQYGYRQAVAGSPSVMQRMMVNFGVYKVQADQRKREQATDAVR